MSLTIPLRNDLPRYNFQIELDGTTFGLEMAWNFRGEYWSMSIFDADGVALLYGVRLVVDFLLASRFRDSRLPAGNFQAMDTSGEQRDPGFNDLGSRVLLLYFAAGEL